jgi:hypothetical protein
MGKRFSTLILLRAVGGSSIPSLKSAPTASTIAFRTSDLFLRTHKRQSHPLRFHRKQYLGEIKSLSNPGFFVHKIKYPGNMRVKMLNLYRRAIFRGNKVFNRTETL